MLRTALAFGADAVYAGQPRYSLRVRNNDFGDLELLAAAIDEAHAAGKQALRGQQRPAAQPQGAQLPGRHGAGGRAQA
jgi:hypothetical protein